MRFLSKIALAAACALPALFAQASLVEGELTIWISADRPHRGLAQLGQQFEAETGIVVNVQHPSRMASMFERDAGAGEGPDIIFETHSMLAQWEKAGLISSVRPDREVKSALSPRAWQALQSRYDSSGYIGFPLQADTVSLLYNRALLKRPPGSWQEVQALDRQLQKQGKRAIMWDYSNIFYTWGIMAAGGAYIFEQHNGTYNPSRSGVNHAGAVDGLTLIMDMRQDGLLPEGAAYAQMEEQFIAGDVAMIINGQWSWDNYQRIDFATAPIPTLHGSPAKPLVNILAAGLNAASPNHDLAAEFLQYYVLTTDGLAVLNQDMPLGAVTHLEYRQVLAAQDPRIHALIEGADQGTVIPPITETDKFWAIMGPTLNRVVNGSQGIREALDEAARRISN